MKLKIFNLLAKLLLTEDQFIKVVNSLTIPSHTANSGINEIITWITPDGVSIHKPK